MQMSPYVGLLEISEIGNGSQIWEDLTVNQVIGYFRRVAQ